MRDHCPFTGEIRGAAHNICNLNLRTVKKIPVFFHNLGGYDSHIIFRNLNKKVDIEEPKVVAKNIEKFQHWGTLFQRFYAISQLFSRQTN